MLLSIRLSIMQQKITSMFVSAQQSMLCTTNTKCRFTHYALITQFKQHKMNM